jgi:ATP-dependent Clp protease ATP-binding subunit ClpC
MNYNFTDRVRTVLAMAREEAVSRRHAQITTEHVLKGLLQEGEGVGAEVLRELGVDLQLLSTTLDQRAPEGQAEGGIHELPYTTGAKKMLEYAMAESRKLNHSYVGSEHLLLGLLHDRKQLPARLLAEQGVGVDEARAKMLELLGTDLPFDPKQAGPPQGFVEAMDAVIERVEDALAEMRRLRDAASQDETDPSG